LHSCYVTKRGVEPDFTNYSKFQETPIFIETLDYIFVSADVQALDADELPAKDAVAGPFPTAVEPSDHVLLAATLRC
jgi:mRNA deadenylase 3'-5' endonuclease subunit Ccr4